MTTLIAPSKQLGYSNIFLDFLANTETAREFYLADSPKDVAEKLDRIEYDRLKLIEILKAQNKEYNSSEKTFENIELIKDARTVTVFSGQQAVFFGGPHLIFIKAVTLVKQAREYSEILGRDVVPLFWIAGDDHDFQEANHTTVLNRQSEEIAISYDSPPVVEKPTAEIILDNNDELSKAKSQLKEALGETDFTPKLYELIDSAYSNGETLVSSFGKLLAALMVETGLILFCPGDRQVKQHAASFFKAIVEHQDELQQLVSRTNSQIVSRGYHLQVEKPEDSTHLFCNDNGRQPVLRNGLGFSIGGKAITKEELISKIESEPEKFSPDVITRPVFQSFLFPVVAQIGGPAEIAYLAQINRVFQLFDLPVPVHLSRPSVTFIEKRYEKLMNEYEITFEELAGDIETVINRVLTKTFPETLDKDFRKFRKNIEQQFEAFKTDSLEFDQSLKKFAEQTYGKIDFSLKNFEAKVFSSHKRKSQEIRDRIYRLWHAVFTGRGFQERTLNISYFISKYGFGFIDFMQDKIDISEKSHQLISLSDFDSK